MNLAQFNFDTEHFKSTANAFLQQHPEIQRLELLFVDINGVLRGKWLPVSSLLKLPEGAFRLPRSSSFVDIWSEDVDALGLGIQVGDPDAICLPIVETLSLVPWANVPSAQMLLTMIDQQDMQLCQYAPRVVLQQQLEKLKAQSLTPVVATELEFYLINPQRDALGAPQPPNDDNGQPLHEGQQYSMELLEVFSPVLQAILDAAAVQNLPVDTTIAECGSGQFEINLLHQNDALLAADQAILLKRVIKQVAKQHGLRASFMAKPYAADMGNGMHVHASLNDAKQRNIFANQPTDNGKINAKLRHAVAGLLDSMPDTQLFYAPHANSYRRFIPGFFAPISPCWGFDHRAAAVRVPATSGHAARLEHRVSGADCNPYLVIAAVLAGIQHGLNHQLEPGEPLAMDANLERLKPMTRHWAIAIEQLAQSAFVQEYFGAEYQLVYSTVKRSEELKFAQQITPLEYSSYLLKV